jgi:hypothetical protein
MLYRNSNIYMRSVHVISIHHMHLATSYFCCFSSFSLRTLNYSAAIFHLIQAAIVLGLIQHLVSKESSSHGGAHSLRSGVYQIRKSLFVIQSSAPTAVDDEIWHNGHVNTKCSLPPVQIYNVSDMLKKQLEALNPLLTEILKYNNVSKNQVVNHTEALTPLLTEILKDNNNKDMMTRDVMISSFGAPNGMIVNAKRNDIFMFEDMYVIPQSITVGDLDTRYIIFSFFLLSGLFQLADGVILGAYTDTDAGQMPRLLRFVEYSFSASIMILAIAVQTGVTDIYALCGIFTLIFTTNILGLIAEVFCCCAESLCASSLLYAKKIDSIMPIPFVWLWTLPHFLGWITCIIGYAPLLDSYLHSTQCSDRGPPGFVNVIVFLEFVLFSSFGFVQFYSLYYRTERLLNPENTSSATRNISRQSVSYNQVSFSADAQDVNLSMTAAQPASISEQADYAYIMLSFVAKTLLAWLILAPVIMNA